MFSYTEDANVVLLGQNDDFNMSFMWTKMDTSTSSLDPDETAHNELSHLDLHCLPFCF